MQKDSLIQYTMTLLQGPKDPVLPTLMYAVLFWAGNQDNN